MTPRIEQQQQEHAYEILAELTGNKIEQYVEGVEPDEQGNRKITMAISDLYPTITFGFNPSTRIASVRLERVGGDTIGGTTFELDKGNKVKKSGHSGPNNGWESTPTLIYSDTPQGEFEGEQHDPIEIDFDEIVMLANVVADPILHRGDIEKLAKLPGENPLKKSTHSI